MSYLFLHYRQVKLVSQSGSTRPQIKESEEIWYGSQGRLRHGRSRESLRPHLLDLLSEPWLEFESFPAGELGDWPETDTASRGPRYIDPHEVESETDSPARKFALREQFSKFWQALAAGAQKVQKIARRLPSALNAAWQELNRTD